MTYRRAYSCLYLISLSVQFKVGGIETVTLGDEEARARRSQKSILERKAPPTFPFLIEMRERNYWVTHRVSCHIIFMPKKRNLFCNSTLEFLMVLFFELLHFVQSLKIEMQFLFVQTERSVDMLLHGKKPLVEVMIFVPYAQCT